MARPSKYSSVNKEQLKILCLKGFTDKEMAAFFKINELTLNRWKKQYPEFCKSLKEAKEEADAKVEKSLFERANGYTHKAVKFFQHGAKIISQEYDEHYPPDPTSMIFWLKNRQPAKWRDKQDGDLNVNIAQIIFKVINNEKEKPSKLSPNLERDTKIMIEQWKENIPLYLKEQLQLPYPITEPQKQVIDAIPIAMKERKPIYIASGHSLGKDFLGGCIANWFLDTCVPSKVVLTAPTDRQVKYIMWAETMTRYNGKKIKWGNPLNEPYIEVKKGEWFLIGFTTKESAGSGGGKFQGIRSAFNQCILVTEAQSVEDNIYDQIDGIATGENVLIVFMGNPTRTDGRFAKGLKDKKSNIVFHFSCLDSPNYKTQSIVIPGLVTYEWVEDKRKRWGEGDPRWISRVLGQVPSQSINKLFGPDVMNKMQERHGFLARFSFNRGVAVDSAGEGMDDNVFMAGSGGEVTEVYTTATIAPSVAAIRAVEMCKACSGNFIIVDADGIGIGVWQELTKMPEQYLAGIQIIKFHGSSAAFDVTNAGPGQEKKRIYANKRAEAAFIARERGLNGIAAVSHQNDYLIEELEADEWFENRSGQIQLIEKKDIKERLDPPRSPGRADCFKMLQWAFDQNYKEIPIYNTSQPMQRVADSDYRYIPDGREDVSNYQQYAD